MKSSFDASGYSIFLMKNWFFEMEFRNLGVRDIPNTQIPEFVKFIEKNSC
jgi:hypothetical protein